MNSDLCFSFPQKNELARLCYALTRFPLSIHTVIYVGGKLILQIEYEATFRFCLQEKNYTQHTHSDVSHSRTFSHGKS
jgi:hypothetical protein